ncbi:MAG: peptidoglycan-binding domain-containing protein [Blastocatellia bacterium]
MKMLAVTLIAALSATEATAQTSAAQQTAAQASETRITEKEVAAAQVELIRRGYLKTKANGTLDRETREAVRGYQADNGLKETGRIDLATYIHLGLVYPVSGPAQGQPGAMSKAGGGVRSAASGAGRAAGGAAKVVGSGARVGLEKTWDLGSAAASKSKDAAQGLGKVTVRGARGAGKSAQRAGDSLLSRDDAEIRAELADSLNADPATQGWQFDIKSGLVTLKAPRGHRADIGAVVSDIRKIVGVKSVFVIAL